MRIKLPSPDYVNDGVGHAIACDVVHWPVPHLVEIVGRAVDASKGVSLFILLSKKETMLTANHFQIALRYGSVNVFPANDHHLRATVKDVAGRPSSTTSEDRQIGLGGQLADMVSSDQKRSASLTKTHLKRGIVKM